MKLHTIPVMLAVFVAPYAVGSGSMTLHPESPGIEVGTTWYEAQHNGTLSRMISQKPDGNVFFVWTNALDESWLERHVFFNSTSLFPDSVGTRLNPLSSLRAGYVTCDATSDNRMVAAYHIVAPMRTAIYVESVVDTFRSEPYIWPHIAVDNVDNVHIVSTAIPAHADSPAAVYYCRTVDAGSTFSAWQTVDTIFHVECEVQASRHSGKVVIAYNHPVSWMRGPSLSDILYVESTDNGDTWDWSAKVNVTGAQPIDTLVPYRDVSAVYDELDSLHLVYTARHMEDTTNLHLSSAIIHWSATVGFTVVYRDTMQGWPCDRNQGQRRLTADTPSLGVDPSTGYLYCVFTASTAGDTSASGWPNNDLWMSYSTDNGLTWSSIVNLTNSSTPGANPDSCDDDEWPSLAEIVNDTVHILYINDKDAGIASAFPSEGARTLNPVLYMKIPVDSVVGIDDVGQEQPVKPLSFGLHSPVPNPCRNSFMVTYEIAKEEMVNLSLYDLAGRLVTTFLSKRQSAGIGTTIYRNSTLPSGIYYCVLEAGAISRTRKVVWLR
ncbi:MAG: T9SS type A sorting domain-containing protein [bacterium]